MGRDKATADFQGRPLIRTVYDTVREVFDDILIISSIHGSLDGIDAPVIDDIIPVQTPMVGIATALLHANKARVFVVACDMPFLTRDAVACLLNAPGGAEITIPMIGPHFQPLHAVYGRSCLPHFLRLIGLDRLKVSGVFPYVTMNVVKDDPSFFNARGDLVFLNVNTVEELKGAHSNGPA